MSSHIYVTLQSFEQHGIRITIWISTSHFDIDILILYLSFLDTLEEKKKKEKKRRQETLQKHWMKSFFPEIFPKVQVRHALTNGPAEKQLQRKQ